MREIRSNPKNRSQKLANKKEPKHIAKKNEQQECNMTEPWSESDM